jgi:hypothetical protein
MPRPCLPRRDRRCSENVQKIGWLLLVGTLGLCHGADAQNSNDSHSKQTQSLLTVRAEVTGQAYCHVDNESFAAHLDLKLLFINSSDDLVYSDFALFTLPEHFKSPRCP